MASGRELSAHPQWVGTLHEYIRPAWDQLLSGDWAKGVLGGNLTLPEMQGWMLQIYPFIHTFPKFLAEALIKVDDDYSRAFLIDNIRVEKAHAEHWLSMGVGFGLRREDMLALAEGERPVLRDVQSLTDWLWHINTRGSLAEAVAATSFAVEGATGELARQVWPGFESYRHNPNVDFGPKTYKWMKEHARYDDEHPKVALEIVKRYATTDRVQRKVMIAAKRSLELLHQALVTSYQAYSPVSSEVVRPVVVEARVSDRRANQQYILFPDRRLRDRRTMQAQSQPLLTWDGLKKQTANVH
jgi:pyrroloquinoline quinone (PQQ) biosynthesis protein C